MKTKEIMTSINNYMLDQIKVSHSVSMPVFCKERNQYYLAVFVFFYTKADIDSGTINRPTMWAIMDVKTGEMIQKRNTTIMDFSDAPYDRKYDIKSDMQYQISKKYYDDTFAILDSVREQFFATGKINTKEYKKYMDRVLKSIPDDYQRFYTDLSVTYN